MTVIGIDPGVATTGFGVVRKEGSRVSLVEYGTIRTPAGIDLGLRLQTLRTEVKRLVSEHQPDAAAIERLLFSNNQKTVMDVARASGVILLALSECGCPVTEYSPPQVKLSVTGEGRAEKVQVQYMVRQLLRLTETPKPDDAADALALALCHLQSQLLSLHSATVKG